MTDKQRIAELEMQVATLIRMLSERPVIVQMPQPYPVPMTPTYPFPTYPWQPATIPWWSPHYPNQITCSSGVISQ